MTQVLGAEKWWTLATAIRDAVAAALDPAMCRVVVMPGNIAWDDCECGLLAVSIARTFVYDVFPEPQREPIGIGCYAPYEAAEIVVQVLRCSPWDPTPSEVAPDVDTVEETARQMSADAVNTLNVVSELMCVMKTAIDVEDYLLGEQMATGPEGGCVGTELRVLVGLLRG